MTLRFGTDGLRGLAGAELTPEVAVALGRVAGEVLAGPGSCVAVGRDTRRSGPMLQAALTAGLAAAGVDVVDVGVLSTPGVAAVAAARGWAAAVVSASHNPFADNGIKLFASGGRKLDDRAEAAIEGRLAGAVPRAGAALTGEAVGTLRADPDAGAWYAGRLLAALEGRGLGGLRVVLDCGHGAAAHLAPGVFAAAGAEVVAAIGVDPDGLNINEGCGSTDTAALAEAVVDHGADVGLAFDGDADRVIAVDEHGLVVDGDRLLALFATDLHRRQRLTGGTVVVTVMTNVGFHRAMAAAGIEVVTTPVGDRHVLAALDANRWSLGGEQSGHLVFRDVATTGDGVLSGLLLMDLVVRAGQPLGALAGAAMRRFPQVLRNVPVADRDRLAGAGTVWAAVAAVEAELGAGGRVLLRPSGTEQLVRVMVEAPSEEQAWAAAERLVATVGHALGR